MRDRPKLDKQLLSDLARKRGKPVLFRSLATLGLYVFTAGSAIALDFFWEWLIVWPVLGLILFGFSAAAHEAIHGNLSGSSIINRLTGAFWLTPLLLNYSAYRTVHLQHHAFNGREGDPELSSAHQSYNKYSYLRLFLRRATIYKPLYISNWRISFQAVKRSCIDFDCTQRERAVSHDFIVLIIWIFTAAVATAIVPRYFILGYWIPVFVFAPSVFTFLSLPEHILTNSSKEATLNTRTVVSNRIIRFIIWDINYHTAHHMFPRVPFYNLRALDDSLKEFMPYRIKSYAIFHWKIFWQL